MEKLRIEYRGFVIIPSKYVEGWFMTECEIVCGESVAEVQQDLDRHIIDQAIGKKVTYYYQGGFGMVKVEGKLIDAGTKKYAQYGHAPYIDMLPKGKRKPVRYSQSYEPFFLVLEGHDHPLLQEGFVELESSSPEMKIKKSRYSSFDPRWKAEAGSSIDQYIQESGSKVVADYRAGDKFSSYSGPVYYKAA